MAASMRPLTWGAAACEVRSFHPAHSAAQFTHATQLTAPEVRPLPLVLPESGVAEDAVLKLGSLRCTQEGEGKCGTGWGRACILRSGNRKSGQMCVVPAAMKC